MTCSSVVERLTVNQDVVGSNPALSVDRLELNDRYRDSGKKLSKTSVLIWFDIETCFGFQSDCNAHSADIFTNKYLSLLGMRLING